MVSKASEDLPDPDSPVITTSWSRGSSTSMFLRLCSRAPRTMIRSLAMTAYCVSPTRHCQPVTVSTDILPASRQMVPMSILSTLEISPPFEVVRLGNAVANQGVKLPRREEHPMQSPIRNIYEQFVAKHYAEKPLRHPVHVEAVIGAAGVRPTDVSQ